jgi:acetylornithine deacetylase/succinyl-diaminopimelate desuccinylase-like protein
VPPDQTAVTRLVNALERIDAYRAPIRLIDPVRDYFKAMAEMDGGPPQFLNLRGALRDPAFTRDFVAVPRQNAAIRDTCTPTVLSGSPETNVIPAMATAEIDCRLLPGADPQVVMANLRKAIDDNSIKLEVVMNFPSISSPRDSLLMKAIDDLAQHEDARVVPTMIASFTDSHYFRQKGLVAYGFIPIEIAPKLEGGVHGVNERIPVKQLGAGIRRTVELLQYLGGR